MHRKKILYLITKSNWGGAQKYVYDLATSLPKNKYDIVVALGGKDRLKTELDRKDIRTIAVKTLTRDVSIIGEAITFFRLLVIFWKERPDILHVNSSKAGGLGALAGRIAGVPKIIFTAHGWAFNETRPWWQKKIIVFLSWLTIALSHITLAVARAVREDIARFPFVQSKIKVVSLGIAPIKFRTKADARAFLCALSPRLRHQVEKKDKIWIGTVAELHPIKGLEYALSAISSLKQDGVQVVYIIIGEGESQVELEKKIKYLGLEETVFLVGHVPDAAQYLKALDIFLFPSLSEAGAYAAIEAGYASLPTIASRVGGIPEIIESGKSGILVQRATSSALHNALRDYLEYPQKAGEHGHALNKYVAHAFSLSVMVAATEAWY